MLGRLRDLPYMILNRKLKHLTDNSKYKLYIKKKESKPSNRKVKQTSNIAMIVMMYKDSTNVELQGTVKAILEQSMYTPAKVFICANTQHIENQQLKQYIDFLCLNHGVKFYTEFSEKMIEKFPYYTFIRCGDIISTQFLCEMEQVISKEDPLILYSDEDEIDWYSGQRVRPYLKPGWSPDTLLDFDYIANSIVFSSKLVFNHRMMEKLLSVSPSGFFNSKDLYLVWMYAYILQATQEEQKIRHLAKVLYHVAVKNQGMDYSRLLKNEYLEEVNQLPDEVQNIIFWIKHESLIQRSTRGRIIQSTQSRIGHVVYDLPEDLFVSVIIPTKDNNAVFEQCVDSIMRITKNISYEVIAVDNGSNEQSYSRYKSYCNEKSVRYVYQRMDFNFSKMCNIGAKLSKGDVLLFLNDDTEIISEDWLYRLSGQAIQKHTGLVGAKLLYPEENRIQHCGILNQKSNITHAFYQSKDHCYHYHNLANAVLNCTAVTGACLAIQNSKFDTIGGWAEEFPIAYNDIELGIRAMKKGYYNVTRNDVILFHHESLSRGSDFTYRKINRLRRERKKLRKLHKDYLGKDPYYNPNLNPYANDYDIDYVHK